jgi:hypothetical protein
MQAKDRYMAITVDNIRSFLAGRPKNLLNPEAMLPPERRVC